MAQLLCTTCGHIGEPKEAPKGNFFIEVILWFCFLIPGIIYSIWRGSNRTEICETCKSENLIPVNSPVARQFIQSTGISTTTPKKDGAAYKMGAALGKMLRKKKP